MNLKRNGVPHRDSGNAVREAKAKSTYSDCSIGRGFTGTDCVKSAFGLRAHTLGVLEQVRKCQEKTYSHSVGTGSTLTGCAAK